MDDVTLYSNWIWDGENTLGKCFFKGTEANKIVYVLYVGQSVLQDSVKERLRVQRWTVFQSTLSRRAKGLMPGNVCRFIFTVQYIL